MGAPPRTPRIEGLDSPRVELLATSINLELKPPAHKNHIFQ